MIMKSHRKTKVLVSASEVPVQVYVIDINLTCHCSSLGKDCSDTITTTDPGEPAYCDIPDDNVTIPHSGSG